MRDWVKRRGGQHQGFPRVPSREGHLEPDGKAVQGGRAAAAEAGAPAHPGLQLLLQVRAGQLQLSEALRPCQHILSGQALHHDLRVAHEAARGEALPAAHVHTVDLLHLAPEAEAQLQHLVADRWQEELGESRQ